MTRRVRAPPGRRPRRRSARAPCRRGWSPAGGCPPASVRWPRDPPPCGERSRWVQARCRMPRPCVQYRRPRNAAHGEGSARDGTFRARESTPRPSRSCRSLHGGRSTDRDDRRWRRGRALRLRVFGRRRLLSVGHHDGRRHAVAACACIAAAGVGVGALRRRPIHGGRRPALAATRPRRVAGRRAARARSEVTGARAIGVGDAGRRHDAPPRDEPGRDDGGDQPPAAHAAVSRGLRRRAHSERMSP